MPAASYALNGEKVFRNGKHIATIADDDLQWVKGQQQFKDEVLAFLADLDGDDDSQPDPEPELNKEPEPEPVAPAPEKKPAKPKRKKEPEPEQSKRYGDLTPEVVHWRYQHWPREKFKETYHRRLNQFPELQD